MVFIKSVVNELVGVSVYGVVRMHIIFNAWPILRVNLLKRLRKSISHSICPLSRPSRRSVCIFSPNPKDIVIIIWINRLWCVRVLMKFQIYRITIQFCESDPITIQIFCLPPPTFTIIAHVKRNFSSMNNWIMATLGCSNVIMFKDLPHLFGVLKHLCHLTRRQQIENNYH